VPSAFPVGAVVAGLCGTSRVLLALCEGCGWRRCGRFSFAHGPACWRWQQPRSGARAKPLAGPSGVSHYWSGIVADGPVWLFSMAGGGIKPRCASAPACESQPVLVAVLLADCRRSGAAIFAGACIERQGSVQGQLSAAHLSDRLLSGPAPRQFGAPSADGAAAPRRKDLSRSAEDVAGDQRGPWSPLASPGA